MKVMMEMRVRYLFHDGTFAEGTGIVVEVLFYFSDDAVLDMDDFVGGVGHTTLMGHHDDGLVLLCIEPA